MGDVVVVSILVLAVCGAIVHIYKNKKSGKSCTGCPDAGNCIGNCKTEGKDENCR